MDLVWIIGIVVAALIVVAVLSRALRAMRPQVPASPGSSRAQAAAAPLTPEVIAEIDRLVAADQKIPAIKLYREHTHVGLQEAKNRIDHWEMRAGHSRTASPTTAPPHAAPLTSEVTAEIDRLVAADQKIQAIKVYREHTGLGLKQSKEAIDGWSTHNL
ncbi:ribosomal protein L7/L12 [Microbacterium sp. GCS4]|uniref:ribosomal protein L7/L12 n=1 Tax=Microbacterium sp. GCS4 TaxID=1692239 RepID=UPI00067FA797|nr:ribosomal protein L7/L12 [Microbacterium sp. GCS4]KNY05802.1 hypothetical protein AKH00_08000 [Microbacterium sp. GCS4]